MKKFSIYSNLEKRSVNVMAENYEDALKRALTKFGYIADAMIWASGVPAEFNFAVWEVAQGDYQRYFKVYTKEVTCTGDGSALRKLHQNWLNNLERVDQHQNGFVYFDHSNSCFYITSLSEHGVSIQEVTPDSTLYGTLACRKAKVAL